MIERNERRRRRRRRSRRTRRRRDIWPGARAKDREEPLSSATLFLHMAYCWRAKSF